MVFLDMEYNNSLLRKMLFYLIIFGIVGFICFFFLSLVVTKAATDPIEYSIKQQTQLVADMSHELKTPLAVIRSNTDIIMSHPDSTVEDQRKWLGYIKDETTSMTELVNNILYLAKSDETNADIEKTDFNMSEAVTASSLPFESVCFEKKKLLITNIEPNIIFHGNKELIMRLSSILIDNACKYAYENTYVRIDLLKLDGKIVLAVHNEGDVIKENDLKHIFERFYRADESRTGSDSFGLGLSIAKVITEQHKGKISAISSAEKGTTFICEF